MAGRTIRVLLCSRSLVVQYFFPELRLAFVIAFALVARYAPRCLLCRGCLSLVRSLFAVLLARLMFRMSGRTLILLAPRAPAQTGTTRSYLSSSLSDEIRSRIASADAVLRP